MRSWRFGLARSISLQWCFYTPFQSREAAAEHVQTTTFALHDFCLYPHWVQELRFELERASQQSTRVDPESLALLDGFVQESMRMSTSDASKPINDQYLETLGMIPRQNACSDAWQLAADGKPLCLSNSPTGCGYRRVTGCVYRNKR